MWCPVVRWWTECRKCRGQSLPHGPFSEMALACLPVSDPSRERWVGLFDSLIHKGLLIFWWSIASSPSGYRLCCRQRGGGGCLEVVRRPKWLCASAPDLIPIPYHYSLFMPLSLSVSGRNGYLIAYLAFDYAAFWAPVLPTMSFVTSSYFWWPTGWIGILKYVVIINVQR